MNEMIQRRGLESFDRPEQIFQFKAMLQQSKRSVSVANKDL